MVQALTSTAGVAALERLAGDSSGTRPGAARRYP